MRRSTDASFPVYLSKLSFIQSLHRRSNHLEQSGDGISSNAPIGISDECLEVDVACRDGLRVVEGKGGEGTRSGELEDRLW